MKRVKEINCRVMDGNKISVGEHAVVHTRQEYVIHTKHKKYYKLKFSSVAQSCPTLCDPMNRSMPGLPVHHQLPGVTQTHVHRVHHGIESVMPSSHLILCRPLLLLPPIPPSIRVFSNESTLTSIKSKILKRLQGSFNDNCEISFGRNSKLLFKTCSISKVWMLAILTCVSNSSTGFPLSPSQYTNSPSDEMPKLHMTLTR